VYLALCYLCLSADGEVYAWGGNNMGELGIGQNNNECIPTLVKGLVGKDVAYLYASNYHSFALTGDGKVYAFGENENRELGLGDTENRNVPCLIEELVSNPVIEIVTAEMHSFALTDDNRVFGWGNNYNGELGLGDVLEHVLPEELTMFRDISLCKIRCGGSFSVALTCSGVLYVWGINCYGQLGLGDLVNRHTPEINRFMINIKVIDVAVGSAQTLCLSEDGTIYVWGYNGRGELGLGDQVDRSIPQVLLQNAKDANMYAYACSRHFFVVTKDKVLTWGVNSNGQLGLGDAQDRERPEELLPARSYLKLYDRVHFVIGYCSTYMLLSCKHGMTTKLWELFNQGAMADVYFDYADDVTNEPARKKTRIVI
jgi:alpha-tubulin suppressor-like RCC1 family protein